MVTEDYGIGIELYDVIYVSDEGASVFGAFSVEVLFQIFGVILCLYDRETESDRKSVV
mgnify:CR=1 FL=1